VRLRNKADWLRLIARRRRRRHRRRQHSDMDEETQQDVVDLASEALEKYNIEKVCLAIIPCSDLAC
jgi:hypothetical protein